MARPSKYSEKIAEEILSRYANGETLSKICKDKHIPERHTVYRWRSGYPDFGEAYILAQEEHVDALVDEAGEIVDTEQNPQLGKLKADHRRWLASRLNRQKYGDKLDVQHNHTLDVSPIISKALERLSNIDVGLPQTKLIEAENPDTDAM